MKTDVSNRWLRFLAAGVLAGMMVETVCGGEPPPAKSADADTSLSADELKSLGQMLKPKLGEEFFKSLKTGGDSFEGAVQAPAQEQERQLTPSQTRRLKEARDRQQYWLFLDPNEMNREQDESLEDAEKNLDARMEAAVLGMKNSPVLERFYKSLDKKDGRDGQKDGQGGTNSTGRGRSDSRRKDDFRAEAYDDPRARDRDPLLSGLSDKGLAGKPADNPIKDLFNSSADESRPAAQPGAFTAIFAPSPIPMVSSPEQEQRMGEFRKMFQPAASSAAAINSASPLPSTPSAFTPSGGSAWSGYSGVGGLGGAPDDSLRGYGSGTPNPSVYQSPEPAMNDFKPITPQRRAF